jgi:hypothetical protein
MLFISNLFLFNNEIFMELFFLDYRFNSIIVLNRLQNIFS